MNIQLFELGELFNDVNSELLEEAENMEKITDLSELDLPIAKQIDCVTYSLLQKMSAIQLLKQRPAEKIDKMEMMEDI